MLNTGLMVEVLEIVKKEYCYIDALCCVSATGSINIAVFFFSEAGVNLRFIVCAFPSYQQPAFLRMDG